MESPLTLYPELLPIGLALALGLLVGIQRGWAQRNAIDGRRFAGVRTFALVGLAGGFAGARLARRLPATWVRGLVIATGVVMSAVFFQRG